MIACVHLNGLVFLLPGLIVGVLITLVIVLRNFWIAERDTSDHLVSVLNDQFEFMRERGIHWGWWENQDPWYPESVTFTQEEQ